MAKKLDEFRSADYVVEQVFQIYCNCSESFVKNQKE